MVFPNTTTFKNHHKAKILYEFLGKTEGIIDAIDGKYINKLEISPTQKYFKFGCLKIKAIIKGLKTNAFVGFKDDKEEKFNIIFECKESSFFMQSFDVTFENVIIFLSECYQKFD